MAGFLAVVVACTSPSKAPTADSPQGATSPAPPTPRAALPTYPPPPTLPPCSSSDPVDCLVARVERTVAGGGFDGQIVVGRQGRAMWQAAFGHDRDGTQMTPQTRLGIASAGKMLTAVAIGQLVDGGQIEFEDEIGRDVRGLPGDVAAATIGELLSHTSGLGMTSWTDGLVVPPGEFRYSNAGFALLDQAVEAVSGMPIGEYEQRHIVKPASMADTSFVEGQPDGSTAVDLMRFVNAVVDGELMSKSTTRAVTSEKVATEFGGYAYGFAIFEGEAGEAPSIGHIGAAPEVVAAVEMSPSIDATVVVVCVGGFVAVEPALIEYQKSIGMGYWRS